MNPKISLVLGIFCISIFPILVKVTPVSGITAAFYRMGIAAAIIWPCMLLAGKWKRATLTHWKGILVCGVLFASDVAVWNLSIKYSTTTQASLLTNLAPVWVGLAAWLFLPNKPPTRFWIGAAIALAGMVVMMGARMFLEMDFNAGFVWAVLSGIFYAAYMLSSQAVLKRVDIWNFMTSSVTVSAVYLFLVCLVLQEPLWGFEPIVWSSLTTQAIVCQLVAWISMSHALSHIDAQRVSLSLLSQVLCTALMASLFIGELISWQMILGGAIILAGIAITFSQHKPTLRDA